jgi:phosphoribosylanthranilate isomerase
MKITKVTITGLDTLAEIDRIVELQKEFPFCEWGILFSSNREGKQRYPTMWVVEKIIKAGIPLSAHFCGTWAKEVLEKQNFDVIKTLHPNFKRVQLNYNFSYNQNWSLTHLNLFTDENRNREIILQYNKSNKPVIDAFKVGFPENINLLYDASGGRGTEIKEVLPPFENYTGYAGGINDTNIESICKIITGNPNNSEVWIDMESGVRTGNDIFDLEKVIAVLNVCRQYVSPIMN